MSSPPAREGGYAGSIANQTAARKQSLACRSPRYSTKSRNIQQADPAGTVSAPSSAISTPLPAAAATLRSIAPAPLWLLLQQLGVCISHIIVKAGRELTIGSSTSIEPTFNVKMCITGNLLLHLFNVVTLKLQNNSSN